jgi:hypothetical protein
MNEIFVNSPKYEFVTITLGLVIILIELDGEPKTISQFSLL